MLIPALRDIQDRHGYLSEAELKLAALRLQLPLYRVQEVASFFPHFRLKPPPTVCVGVCQSMTCGLRGSTDALTRIQDECQAEIKAGGVEVCGVSCLGRCDQAPVIALERFALDKKQRIHDHFQGGFEPAELVDEVVALIRQTLDGKSVTHAQLEGEKPLWQINVYDDRHGGEVTKPWAAVRKCLEPGGTIKLLEAIKTSGLVGMGGAAARTANKWSEVLKRPEQPKYVICNADESEPGTFKDRELLLHASDLVVEGLMIAGLTVGASRGYVYIRHEYPDQINAIENSIKELKQQAPEAWKRCPLEVFVSPGAYICGEESALIEAIEGKRAQPRDNGTEVIRTNGLHDKPTVVNNVETLAWVPAVVLREAGKWYRDTSLRFFSVSGDVKTPGVHELPITQTLGGLMEQHCGGMRPDHELHAVATSGPSGGFLPRLLSAARLHRAFANNRPALLNRSAPEAERLTARLERLLPEGKDLLDVRDLPLDVGLFRALNLALGAGIVVYGRTPDQTPNMLDHALNCLSFFAKESCGKCVPCRLGCQQLVYLAGTLKGGANSVANVAETVQGLARVMKTMSICGLGRLASNPLTTFLDYFGDEPEVKR